MKSTPKPIIYVRKRNYKLYSFLNKPSDASRRKKETQQQTQARERVLGKEEDWGKIEETEQTQIWGECVNGGEEEKRKTEGKKKRGG